MKVALRTTGVTLGFFAAMGGILALGIGIRRRDEHLLQVGRRSVVVVLIGAVLAVAMEWALVTHGATEIVSATTLLLVLHPTGAAALLGGEEREPGGEPASQDCGTDDGRQHRCEPTAAGGHSTLVPTCSLSEMFQKSLVLRRDVVH